jgi:hypothetical protein
MIDDGLFGFEDKRAREKRLADLEEKARMLREVEERQRAERMKKVAERSAEFNRRHLLAEYQAAGVKPPKLDEKGRPTCSLSLLLCYGWEVMKLGDGRSVLVAPAPTDHDERPRRTRDDYQNAEGR